MIDRPCPAGSVLTEKKRRVYYCCTENNIIILYINIYCYKDISYYIIRYARVCVFIIINFLHKTAGRVAIKYPQREQSVFLYNTITLLYGHNNNGDTQLSMYAIDLLLIL